MGYEQAAVMQYNLRAAMLFLGSRISMACLSLATKHIFSKNLIYCPVSVIVYGQPGTRAGAGPIP